MKKILGIVVLSLLLSGNVYARGPNGEGDLKLSPNTLLRFQDYLRGGVSDGSISTHNRPMSFWITLDGKNTTWWYCPHGQCQPGSPSMEKKACEEFYNKDCARFAKGRTVKWKNDINPGKGKQSTFNSKWSNAEITAKLTELGFLGGSTSKKIEKEKKAEKKKEPKKEVKKSKNDEDIVEKIKDLKELLDTGALTEEEFVKAKKKLLN
jgi:hypothetical protein